MDQSQFLDADGKYSLQRVYGFIFGELYRVFAAFILLPLISSACGCMCVMIAVAMIMSNPEKAKENKMMMGNAFLASMAEGKGASPQ